MQLILVDPRSGRRKVLDLGAQPLRVGSGVDCDLVLPDAEIAAHALTIQSGPDGVVVEAAASSTFFLNERRTRAAIVHVGDVLKVGAFQLVVAPREAAAAPTAPPSPMARPPLRVDPRAALAFQENEGGGDSTAAEDDAEGDATAEPPRGSTFAERRKQKKRTEAWVGALLITVAGGGLAWGWRLGWFDGAFKKSSDRSASTTSTAATPGATSDGRNWMTEPGPNEQRKDVMAPALEVDPDTGETFARDDSSWRKASSSSEIDATFAKVALLLENEEFARCRWLMWKLNPQGTDDVARVETRRAEVEAATKAGGESHLAFVDELLKKGKLMPALSHCVEDSIERFRGTETWYALLEKADEIEAIINERVPEARRPTLAQKHARTRPANLATRTPPPAKVTFAEEFAAVPKRSSAAPVAKGPPREPTTPPAKRPSDGAMPNAPTPEAETSGVPTPPVAPVALTAEQLAAQTALSAAFAAIDSAKPASFVARLDDMVEAANRAEGAAVGPLLARLEALATELAVAPEQAQLAELRAKVQALRAARESALAYLFDEQRYFMLDPKSSGDMARGDELAAAQKEADRQVESVRALFGNEMGSAPGPLVALSESYARRVAEVQAIDALLAAQKRPLPDHAELLATRLLPPGTTKVHVRNLALDVDERARLDRDREVRSANQRLRDVSSDAVELLVAVNSYRELFGRGSLVLDVALVNSAALIAAQRAKDAKGQKESDPQPLPEPTGVAGAAGVNFLRGHFGARQALKEWTKIAGAHRNLLSADHRALGAAAEPKYWVAKFGRFLPGASDR